MPTNIQAFADSIGYEIKTTFWQDFTIADKFGKDAIQDTYNRAFNEWKDDKIYGTELDMILNWKSWEHSKDGIVDEIGSLYVDLYYKLRDYILDNWSKDDVRYFLQTTD